MDGLVCGRYRITAKLGEGGMAEVWLAKHELIDQEAAVKLLQPQMSVNAEVVKRFMKEAQAAAAIQHPGIVEIYDVGYSEGGRAYIVMERLRGEPLGDRLKREGQLSVEQTVRLMRQLSGVMEAAHEKRIFHRDLKPDNLFVVPDPEVQGGERIKVLDFGLAKLATEFGGSIVTSRGAIFGTPAYMAPEQCQDSGRVDGRADLYSIGCILYRCLCGRPPFDYKEPLALLQAQLRETAKEPRLRRADIPVELDALIMRLLAKEPHARVQNCRDLVSEFDAIAPTSANGNGDADSARTLIDLEHGHDTDQDAVAKPDHAATLVSLVEPHDWHASDGVPQLVPAMQPMALETVPLRRAVPAAAPNHMENHAETERVAVPVGLLERHAPAARPPGDQAPGNRTPTNRPRAVDVVGDGPGYPRQQQAHQHHQAAHRMGTAGGPANAGPQASPNSQGHGFWIALAIMIVLGTATGVIWSRLEGKADNSETHSVDDRDAEPTLDVRSPETTDPAPETTDPAPETTDPVDGTDSGAGSDDSLDSHTVDADKSDPKSVGKSESKTPSLDAGQITALIEQAKSEFADGAYADAYKTCRSVLVSDWRHVEANKLCAMSACKLNKSTRIITRYHKHLTVADQAMVVKLCRLSGITL